ncbi:MAG: hypothetical protein KKE23_03735 [Nanoarchaeota archaeon]|nr:hypothetical protein [Nanoarchaeota archaeon]
MSIINYIVYTEPANVQHGNGVKIYLREWDTVAKKGKSKTIIQPIKYIVPSMEQKSREVPSLIEKFSAEYPNFEFEKRPFYGDKEIIWAITNNRKKPKERERLPDMFLDKQRIKGVEKNKSFFSQQLRFFYPPFTLVNIDEWKGSVVLPSEHDVRRQIGLEDLIEDNGCSLDIETVDYTDPEKERISNVIINFGKDKKYLVTTLVHPDKKGLWGCKLISVRGNSNEIIHPKESTKRVVREVNDIIKREDPLKLFGYNLFAFDNPKLRDLGEGEYLPGADKTKPAFKSVQGLKNMIVKGRISLDIYTYKFLLANIFENNKLETHARMEGIKFTKSMPYAVLELKTKLGEAGFVKEMEKTIYYCSMDGDVMLQAGKSNERKILSKALFVGRSPETICTSPGGNIMKEYWEKKYFLKNNTLRGRYNRGYNKGEFKISEYKKSLLRLRSKNGIFNDVSLVYPLFLIKEFDHMLNSNNMKKHLSFETLDDKLDSYQTLEGYISQTASDMERFLALARKGVNENKDPSKDDEKRFEMNSKLRKFDYIAKMEYGIGLFESRENRHKYLDRTNEILDETEQINHSNKFLYLKNPGKLLDENLAFEYGKGSCLSSGKRAVALVDGKLIYSGFGLSKGNKCTFDVDLMREILKRKLSFENNEQIFEYMGEQFSNLANGKIKNRNLLFKDRGKKKFNGKEYGLYDGGDRVIEDFLGIKCPDYPRYFQNFAKSYKEVLETIFRENNERERLSELLNTDFKVIPIKPAIEQKSAEEAKGKIMIFDDPL